MHSDEENPFFQNKPGRSVAKLSEDMLCHTSLPKLLRYEDRNSMAHSIESRVPFCDPELVTFLRSLPPEYLIRGKKTKAVMRQAMNGLIPDSVLNRTDKIGFEMSQQKWMSDSTENLYQIMKNANERLPGLFAKSSIDEIKEEVSGVSSKSSMSWRIASTAIWVDSFDIQE